AVEQEGEVELLGDLGALGDHQGLHDVALDVEAEDLLGTCRGLLGTVRELDAAGLAAAARLDLSLDDDGPAAQLLGGLAGLLRTPRDDPLERGNPVLLEDVPGLVLEQVHPAPPFIAG